MHFILVSKLRKAYLCIHYGHSLLNRNDIINFVLKPLREAEAWLAEELEEICRGMLSYKVHRDIPGVGRFKKETTRLASIFKDMGAQGVEVGFNFISNSFKNQFIRLPIRRCLDLNGFLIKN